MDVTIYDTNTKTLKTVKEDWYGYEDKLVFVYFCGPTVYDKIHIGNLRSFITSDILYRVLLTKYNVIFVRNITDIDDKIINKMKEEEKSFEDFVDEKISFFNKDVKNMNFLNPTYQPRATESMTSIKVIIGKLIHSGYAYISNGSVYFDTSSVPDVRKIFNKPSDNSESRIEENKDKKNKEDFVLWKKETDGPVWDSPWGKGRPGWNTECVAMIKELIMYSKTPISIHGGGIDLQFPHHANEHLQNYALYKENLSDIWMHVNMLTIDGKKMSKSSGKKILISEILEKYHADIIRYYFMSTHYSKILDFSYEKLDSSSTIFKELFSNIENHIDFSGASAKYIYNKKEKVLKGLEFLYNDLNTSEFFNYVRELSQSDIDDDKRCAAYLLTIVGFKLDGNYYNIILSDNEIEELIIKRDEYRKNKDWEHSDEIRNKLRLSYIEVNDTDNGTVWSRI